MSETDTYVSLVGQLLVTWSRINPNDAWVAFAGNGLRDSAIKGDVSFVFIVHCSFSCLWRGTRVSERRLVRWRKYGMSFGINLVHAYMDASIFGVIR